MSTNDERRRSFRVKEKVLLSFQPLSDDEFRKGIDRWRLRAGGVSGLRSRMMDLDSRLDETLYRVGSDLPGIGEIVKLLNDKIETVIEALPDFQDTRNDLVMRSSQKCELSSEGMSFGVNEPLKEGARILVRFLVLPENRLFEMFARVVRSTPVETDEMGPFSYRVGVEFHGMSAAERENLIQHLFSKQSAALRRRRKEAESKS